MSWCLPRLYKNISHRDYPCFSFAGCLANNQFSVCRTCTKYICETYLWLPGVQSTAEPHTDNTLPNTPANVCRKLESKFLSLCYVQLEGRVMLPQSEPWSAICLFPSSFQLSKRGSPALLGTCAWSCSSSLVENAVRQCGGTSISATIFWIWLLMLSHSSALKNCSRTRKPSLWN